MKRKRTTFGLALSAWLAGAVVLVAQTTQPLPGLTQEQTAKLVRCRAIIENVADSESTRRSQAEELLLTGWPAAIDVLVELLATTGDGAPRGIVANAVAKVGRDRPDVLDPRLVEPLMRVLSEDPLAGPAASAALSTFREEPVIERLGALAQDASRPVGVRLAAVDALAPNIDLRPVIAQLIPLLNAPEPELAERAYAALAPASRKSRDRDSEDWQAWWAAKAAMDETTWLRDRVDLLSQRCRELQARLDQDRRELEDRYNAISKRLSDLLRLNLRLTVQPAQKDELLLAWLRDPLTDLRLAAITLLAEQVYEQQRPSEAVRAALRERYADPTEEVRKAALELVGALGDPADLDPILARLAVEPDVDVREVILGVLGKLRNPAAINVLITEIADESAFSACVTRAAQSLALLARESPDPAVLARAIEPLQTRLARQEPAGDARARGALLAAMASIGSPEFTASFIAHLEHDHPEILLPAVRGLAAVGERSQTARLRTLMGHSDPRVRVQAIEALGTLGGDPADLEALLGRLTAAGEPNEPARMAAWSAFSKLLKPRSAETRLAWASRLRDVPERHIDLLIEIVEDLAAGNGRPPELSDAKEQLAKLLIAQKRYTEASRYLDELCAEAGSAPHALTGQWGVLLLDATLRSGKHDRLDALLPRLAGLGEDVRAGVVQTVSGYLTEAMKGADPAGLPDLVARIERASGDLFGPEFRDYLQGVRERLATPPTSAGTNKT